MVGLALQTVLLCQLFHFGSWKRSAYACLGEMIGGIFRQEGENTADVYSLSPGTRIRDRYIIGETLGLGGFGITYKEDTEKVVAAIGDLIDAGVYPKTLYYDNKQSVIQDDL